MLAREITDYAGLLEAIRSRMRELDVTFATVDFVGGLQSGYSQKLLGGTPCKTFGPVSLGCVLGTLGLRLICVEDPAALALVKDRLVPRWHGPVHQVQHVGVPRSGAVAAAGEIVAVSYTG